MGMYSVCGQLKLCLGALQGDFGPSKTSLPFIGLQFVMISYSWPVSALHVQRLYDVIKSDKIWLPRDKVHQKGYWVWGILQLSASHSAAIPNLLVSTWRSGVCHHTAPVNKWLRLLDSSWQCVAHAACALPACPHSLCRMSYHLREDLLPNTTSAGLVSSQWPHKVYHGKQLPNMWDVCPTVFVTPSGKLRSSELRSC